MNPTTGRAGTGMTALALAAAMTLLPVPASAAPGDTLVDTGACHSGGWYSGLSETQFLGQSLLVPSDATTIGAVSIQFAFGDATSPDAPVTVQLRDATTFAVLAEGSAVVPNHGYAFQTVTVPLDSVHEATPDTLVLATIEVSDWNGPGFMGDATPYHARVCTAAADYEPGRGFYNPHGNGYLPDGYDFGIGLVEGAAPPPPPPPPVRVPVAEPVEATTAVGAGTTFTLPSTGDGTLTYDVTQPRNGSVTVDGTEVTYTPIPGYVGTDTFTYTATNRGGTSEPVTITVTVTAPDVPFSDPQGGFGDTLERLRTLGVVAGFPDGSFVPQQAVTPGQFSLMTARVLQKLDPASTWPTDDVAARSILVDRRIVTDDDSGTPREDEPLTRAEAAAVLARLHEALGATLPDHGRPFVDVSGRHADAINGLRWLGVVQGVTGTTFRPDDTLTRGQAALLLARLHEHLS